jgi:uncharacterized protein YprB with RNaseH-like and TPR domain
MMAIETFMNPESDGWSTDYFIQYILMNLKDKLNFFYNKKTLHKKSDTKIRLDSVLNPRRVFLKQSPPVIEEIIEGTLLPPHHEGLVQREHVTDISYSEKDDEITGAFQTLSDQSIKPYSLSETLFIDTETTGLTRGTGTYAFVIGVGFFHNYRFVVRQYFLKKFDSEEIMLESLENLLTRYRHIISFNGKCYDIPLLINRFILCQTQSSISDKAHTDLLHFARIIWRDRLDSLTFSNLEKVILRKNRKDDIPGSMIPSAYFNYQRTGETGALSQILNHNLDDITGLLLLYKELSQRFVCAEKYKDSCFPAARYLFVKAPETACDLLKSSINDPHSSEDAYQAMKLLALYHKKKGDYDQALLYWEKMIHLDPQAELTPFIELAKYYEHKVRDLIKAQEYVNRALSFNFPLDDAICHRQNRIEQKLLKA